MPDWRSFLKAHHETLKASNPNATLKDAMSSAAPLYRLERHARVQQIAADQRHEGCVDTVALMRRQAKHARGVPKKNLNREATIQEHRTYGRQLVNTLPRIKMGIIKKQEDFPSLFDDDPFGMGIWSTWPR
jgi:hypothetical protein